MPAEPHDNEPVPDATCATGSPDVPDVLDVPDVVSLDLESLRTVDHPVLSALVSELRERAADPGTQALWGFDNAM